ncbi:putative signal transducing protein [Salinimicrobium sediminilitoris]|jgi:hypothetical protein|uniref:putative signal transducing protein n=1 Tax=Salinimicrobium sediminilitoris TaxID=2876715 RepID=UPI001E43C197|nr:DUF2007 domain-containing protein [Salinimicrobium sediminilitoris]MCC8359523.1 DUF2007 domain-containing protein [Salinimicrobium sediminilitoris]
MEKFITLAVFTYPHEYQVLKLILEREGIQCFFQNETMVGVFPFYSNALGGIHLKVHHLDLSKAQEILDSFNDNPAPLKIV